MFRAIKTQWSISAELKEFLCSSVDDISKLPKFGIEGTQVDSEYMNNEEDNEPCMYGSTAMVCDGSVSDVYILNPDNNWVKL